MNIDEAITDLSIQLEVKHQLGKDHQANALQLAIEALRLIVKSRNRFKSTVSVLLPGETEE